MLKTITSFDTEYLYSCYNASKKGTRKGTFIHTRNGVETVCHGYHKVGQYLSLIRPDMSYLLVQEGDTVHYDDGN